MCLREGGVCLALKDQGLGEDEEVAAATLCRASPAAIASPPRGPRGMLGRVTRSPCDLGQVA